MPLKEPDTLFCKLYNKAFARIDGKRRREEKQIRQKEGYKIKGKKTTIQLGSTIKIVAKNWQVKMGDSAVKKNRFVYKKSQAKTGKSRLRK